MAGSEQQPQQQSTPKTFIQQFLEMQTTVASLDQMMVSVEKGFAITGASIKGVLEEQKLLSDQLQAMYILSEKGEKITRASVAQKVQDLRVDAAKAKLDGDVKSGLLTTLEVAKDANSIVVYEDTAQKIMFAYNPVSAFSQELQKDLIGKKAGDIVGSVKILGVYEVNEEAFQKDQSNVQAQ